MGTKTYLAYFLYWQRRSREKASYDWPTPFPGVSPVALTVSLNAFVNVSRRTRRAAGQPGRLRSPDCADPQPREYPGAAYHVMARGRQGRAIFAA
jgi:hypothetical protein